MPKTLKMYHSKKYDSHNKALNEFIRNFNKAAEIKGNKLEMYYQEIENFKDDGGIIFKENNSRILYDFEKRFSYYVGCGGFRFKTLGQFDRKIRKPEIKLSIQCSSDEKCFLIAWHEDYYLQKNFKIGSVTQSGSREYDGKRFTEDFKEIAYNKMDVFYDVLLYAFENNQFNKNSFNVID